MNYENIDLCDMQEVFKNFNNFIKTKVLFKNKIDKPFLLCDKNQNVCEFLKLCEEQISDITE